MNQPQTAKALEIADVLAIRAARDERRKLRPKIKRELSDAALAERFGVSTRTVQAIHTGKTWRWLA